MTIPQMSRSFMPVQSIMTLVSSWSNTVYICNTICSCLSEIELKYFKYITHSTTIASALFVARCPSISVHTTYRTAKYSPHLLFTHSFSVYLTVACWMITSHGMHSYMWQTGTCTHREVERDAILSTYITHQAHSNGELLVSRRLQYTW